MSLIDPVARHDDSDCSAVASGRSLTPTIGVYAHDRATLPTGWSGALISASLSIHGSAGEMSAAGGAAIVVAAGVIIPLLEAGQAREAEEPEKAPPTRVAVAPVLVGFSGH